MRRFLGCTLALVIVVVGAADPICCADGCGRAGLAMTATAGTTGAAVDCPFCSGFLDSASGSPVMAVVPIASVDRTARSLTPLLLTITRHRPPRSSA